MSSPRGDRYTMLQWRTQRMQLPFIHGMRSTLSIRVSTRMKYLSFLGVVASLQLTQRNEGEHFHWASVAHIAILTAAYSIILWKYLVLPWPNRPPSNNMVDSLPESEISDCIHQQNMFAVYDHDDLPRITLDTISKPHRVLSKNVCCKCQ